MSYAADLSLKPCPFCGGDAEYWEERIYRIPFNNLSWKGVKCRKCGGAYISTDINHCAIDVYEGWNKRTFGMTVNQYGNNSKCIGRVENLTIER